MGLKYQLECDNVQQLQTHCGHALFLGGKSLYKDILFLCLQWGSGPYISRNLLIWTHFVNPSWKKAEPTHATHHTDLEDIMRSPLNVVEQILDEKLILRARFGFWEFHHLVPLPAANINAWTSGRPVLSYFVVVPSFILTFAAQALSVASLASSTATLLFGSHFDIAVSTMFSHQRRAALV